MIQNPLLFFGDRSRRISDTWSSKWPRRDAYRICLEGMGDWGINTYRKAVASCKRSGIELVATYRDIRALDATVQFEPWEQFEHKVSGTSPVTAGQDLFIVCTPDDSHMPVLMASKDAFRAAIVEKPFCIEPEEIDRIKETLGMGSLWGIDHFPYYVSKAHDHAERIWEHLGGTCRQISFVLTQSQPTESYRLPSLGCGLGYDMLSHFFAILAAFGFNFPVSGLTVHHAAQHRMDDIGSYEAETFLDIEFWLEPGPEEELIRCRARAGKGLSEDVKCLDLLGKDGSLARLDLGSRSWTDTFPTSCVSLLHLDPSRVEDFIGSLRSDDVKVVGRLDTDRPYASVLADLLQGELKLGSGSCLLSIPEAKWVVQSLSKMKAELCKFFIQNNRVWPVYEIGGIPNPMTDQVGRRANNER